MNTNLDDLGFYKVDTKSVFGHINNFAENCLDGYVSASKVTLPPYFIKTKKIVFVGMGGSGTALDMMKSILKERSSYPVESIHDYSLPKYVDSETLVVLSSYSGDTEEPLSAFLEAKDRGAKIVTITSGGKLRSASEKFGAPCFIVDYDSEPRFAFPFMFMAVYSIFEKLGMVEPLNIDEIVSFLKQSSAKYEMESKKTVNHAKLVAEKIYNKVVVIWADEQSYSVALRLKSNINENAKGFSFCEQYPELNHNSIQGVKSPSGTIAIIDIESNFANERVTKRQNITSEILGKQGITLERVKFIEAKTRIEELLIGCIFSDWVSYYLAVMNKQDPSDIRNVEYLKSRL